MLGDASLQTQNKGKTYRLKFEWSVKHKAYLYHVYNLFDEWVLSEPHKKSRFSPKGNLVTNFGFQTISHKAFNFLAELFINKNNKKIISNLLIMEYLTERSLAYWFLGLARILVLLSVYALFWFSCLFNFWYVGLFICLIPLLFFLLCFLDDDDKRGSRTVLFFLLFLLYC